jgi:hypothetical protein
VSTGPLGSLSGAPRHDIVLVRHYQVLLRFLRRFG